MTGVLAGIEDQSGADLRDVESFVGTSAGAIVAARLAAGKPLRRPPRPAPAPPAPEAERRGLLRNAARWGWAATSPLAPVATAVSAPGGALLRSAMLSRAPRHRAHAGAAARRARARRRALRRAPARVLRRPALGPARRVRGARRAARHRGRGRDGVVRHPVGLRPRAHRRARLRRRRRVERSPTSTPPPPAATPRSCASTRRRRCAHPCAGPSAWPSRSSCRCCAGAAPAYATSAPTPRRRRRWGRTTWPRDGPPRRWRPGTVRAARWPPCAAITAPAPR